MNSFRPAKIIVRQGHRTSTSVQKIPDIWRRRIYRFSGNCFFSCAPDYRLWVDFFFFCMNKHLSNNEQNNNVLREKKNILFLFCCFLRELFGFGNACWLSRTWKLAFSFCGGHGLWLLKAECTGEKETYRRCQRKAGEWTSPDGEFRGRGYVKQASGFVVESFTIYGVSRGCLLPFYSFSLCFPASAYSPF